jgi:hypothetical protein
MNTIPSLIIVTNRGHLMAYQLDDSGQIHRIDSATFSDGDDRISEFATNPSSAFLKSGGNGTCTLEYTSCAAELETCCYRRIAAKIREIIDREGASCWAFVTPPEINESILDGLGESYLQRLAINLKRNLGKVPQQEIKVYLEKALLADS